MALIASPWHSPGAEDWQLLFDGSTWNNWSPGRAEGAGPGRRLFTLESYKDFDLQFDWRIEHDTRIRVVGWGGEHWLDGRRVLTGDLKSAAMKRSLQANLAKAQRANATTARERYDASVSEDSID